MPQSDFIARLTLNAQEFSSGTARALAEMEARAEDTAGRLQNSFERSFSEVQQLARKALTLPQLEGGTLNLDVAGARAAAAAAHANADALDQIAAAASRAAANQRQISEETRLYVRAAEAAAIEARQTAAALDGEARSLEILQLELRKVQIATGLVERAHVQGAGASRQHQQAIISLGQQFGDFSTQVLSGQSAAIAFAQQLPQAAYALNGLEGSLGAVGAFLTGPWGVALTIGISAVAVLGSTLLQSGDDARKARGGLEDYGTSIDSIRERAERASDAVRNLTKTAAVGRRDQIFDAEYNRNLIQNQLNTLLKSRDQRAANFKNDTYVDPITAALMRRDNRAVVSKQGELDEANRTLAALKANDAYEATLAKVAAATDKAAAANQRYRDTQDRLRAEVIAGTKSQGQAEAELLVAARQRDAALKKASASGTSASTGVRDIKAAADEAFPSVDKLVQSLGSVGLRDLSQASGHNLDYLTGRKAETIHDVIAARDAAREADTKFEEEKLRAARQAQEELARQQEQRLRNLSELYLDLFDSRSGDFWSGFERRGKAALAALAAQATLSLLSGQKFDLGTALGRAGDAGGLGALLGSSGGGLASLFGGAGGLAKLFGGGSSNAALSNLPGFAEKAAGAAGAASGLGGLAGAASAAAPYLAAAAIALPLVSGLFKKTKKGSATIGFLGDDLGVTSLTGNSSSRKQAASSGAGSIIDSLQNIAEQLGGTLNGNISTSIGVRKNSYRVDTTGAGRTKNQAGVLDFGQDEEAAIRAAISDALQDGVINGISDAAKRILASGKDLDKAIQDALSIESITTQLQARLDPTGAAIDAVKKKFEALVKLLDESGASAEQRADAEKLYRLELEDAKKTANEARQTLAEFSRSLMIGSDSPLSLRDQESAARAALDPFLASIGRGEAIDTDKYQQAASAFLDIEKSLYGSTEQFFSAFQSIQEATNKAIASIDAATPIRGTTADPFAAKTASATQATAEIAAQQTDVLLDIQATLARIEAQGGASASAFIGSARNFNSLAA